MTRPYALPAMVNAHSHAFQRDLRGRGERTGARGRGAGAERPASRPDGRARSAGAERPASRPDDFWSWREQMYALAAALDPDRMRDVAARTYAEMAAAGYGAVGEFHYVHHRPDGTPYDDPNALAKVLAEAGAEAGLAIVLLPAAYHRAGPDLPPAPGQRRFCDPTVERFLERVDALRAWAAGRERVHVGIAAHSVRAVPADWLEAIAAYSERHSLPRHVHAHEQPRELTECWAEHHCSPIELLGRTGFLGERASVVHGIHVTPADVELLAATGTTVVTCPTTEGNLGDGYLPALAYRDAGVRLAIGSDSNVRIDPFEEARELETLARRERQAREALLAAHGDLWAELADAGLRSLGLADAGTIAIDLDHPQLRGVEDADVPLAVATCASAAVVIR